MMVSNAIEKVKGRAQRAPEDIRRVSLSGSDLRAVHFFVEPSGRVHQMAKVCDVIEEPDVLLIDCLEATPDATDSIKNIVLSLAGEERVPKVYVERGSQDILSDALAARINKDVKYLHDTGTQRLPAQFGIIL